MAFTFSENCSIATSLFVSFVLADMSRTEAEHTPIEGVLPLCHCNFHPAREGRSEVWVLYPLRRLRGTVMNTVHAVREYGACGV